MDVSIVIVSWKVKEQLKKCLQSIYKNTHEIDYEVFVVDNNSDDGTNEMINHNFSDTKLIMNETNKGFAYGCNQAIKSSKGDYILLLNPDTEVKNQSIKQMVNFIKKQNNYGIAGCKIVNEDGTIQPSVRSFPDLISHIFILLKLHNLTSNLPGLEKYYQSNFDYHKTQQVDQVMGAFYLIDRRLIKHIGLLDENFFIWYEEVDFCKRAMEKGWLTMYNSEVEIVHQKGSSFSQVNPIKKQYIFNKSLLHYFFKHSNTINYLILLLLTPISMLITLLIQLLGLKKKRKDL